MVWDILVRTRHEDAGLKPGLRGLNDELKNVARAGPQAGTGLRMVENGVRTLAFQAVGVSGPVGRMVGGLGMLGLGAGPMSLVLAGLAAASFLIKELTQDARDNSEATKKMNDELGKLGAHGQAQVLRNQISALEDQRDRPSLGRSLARGALGIAREGPIFGAQNQRVKDVEAINAQIATLQNQINRLLDDLANPSQRLIAGANLSLKMAVERQRLNDGTFQGGPRAGQRFNELDMRQRMREMELGADPNTRGVAIQVAAEERRAQAINLSTDAQNRARDAMQDASLKQRMLLGSEEDVTEALRIEALVRQGLDRSIAASIAAREKETAANLKTVNVMRNQLPAAFAAMGRAATESMQAVAQSAVSSLVQIASALPGVTPVESGLIGFVGGLLGGLFGSRSHPMPVQVTNPEDLRPEGPDRFTLQIISASTGEMIDEIVYELGRRTRLDRIVRIPRGVVIRS